MVCKAKTLWLNCVKVYWIWKTHRQEYTKFTGFWRKLCWIACYSNTDSAVSKVLTAGTVFCAALGWWKPFLGLFPSSLGTRASTRHLLAIPVTSGATDACNPILLSDMSVTVWMETPNRTPARAPQQVPQEDQDEPGGCWSWCRDVRRRILVNCSPHYTLQYKGR